MKISQEAKYEAMKLDEFFFGRGESVLHLRRTKLPSSKSRITLFATS